MPDSLSYSKIFLSIIFITIAVLGFSYSFQWYTEKYNEGYKNSGAAIDKQISNSETLDEDSVKPYTEMQENANVINNLLFVLFFLAVIVFLIFWLIIMLRRAILNN